MLRGRNVNWGITLCCGSAFLLFGYDQGVMSGLLTGAAFTATFPEIDTTPTGNGSASLQGTVVAIYEIGCLMGSLTAFFFGDRLGRRKTIGLGCSILIVGAALQTSAYGIPQAIVARIVTGVGNGMNTATVPVWHSETTSAKSRGTALAIELAINIFGMLAYWVDYGFSFVKSQAQFRVPLALQMVFALATIGLLFVLPESPRWLLKKGRDEEARAVLDQLSMHADDAQRDAQVSNDYNEIKAALAEEEANGLITKDGKKMSGMRACFTNGKERFFHRVMLGVGSQFMQQLCGINLITYYAPVIFESSVGLSRDISLLLSGFNGVAYFLSSLIPIWIIDRVGRRKLMLFAVIGQACCMAVLAGTTSVSHKATGIVAATMLFLFNFFFAVGLLAIPWLLPSEYSPTPIRSTSAALGSASNWIFTFLVVEITPVSIKSIGYRTYIYFAVFNSCFIPLIYFFYPESANLTLEQIDYLFTGEKVLLHMPEGLQGHRHGVEGAEPARLNDSSDKDEKAGLEYVEDRRA
ncbi:hypothetical protein NliqN6_0198 [Naganishia liquefaciens]|uniref:Major facilitator superfamily (MFS) profile domain-containing protein n=1 Tax=Naganishia liquefaciens TaxID=104408 RepID=A0A8H3TN67_9TREE|nr:hypothetical protein NliqN6_0198 [Naganishia liquefaciens]